MRLFALSVVLSALTSAVEASPGKLIDLARRAACNADNCYRAVLASNLATGPARGSAGCSSFLQATVSPCPSTTTRFLTVTTTAATATQTSFVTATSSEIDTATSISTSMTTLTSSTTTVVLTTVSTTTTTTSTSTSFTTITETQEPPGLQTGPLMNKRQSGAVASCTASTIYPASVPAYASTCSGTSRYISACSCISVTSTTTTLAQGTVTVDSIATSTISPTITVTLTTTTATTVTTTSQATTIITLTVTATSTVSSTTSAISTITSSATICQNHFAQVSGTSSLSTFDPVITTGPYSNYDVRYNACASSSVCQPAAADQDYFYVSARQANDPGDTYLVSNPDESVAIAQNQAIFLRSPVDTVGAGANDANALRCRFDKAYSSDMHCRVANRDGTYRSQFYVCNLAGQTNPLRVYLASSDPMLGSGCTPITFTASLVIPGIGPVGCGF